MITAIVVGILIFLMLCSVLAWITAIGIVESVIAALRSVTEPINALLCRVNARLDLIIRNLLSSFALDQLQGTHLSTSGTSPASSATNGVIGVFWQILLFFGFIASSTYVNAQVLSGLMSVKRDSPLYAFVWILAFCIATGMAYLFSVFGSLSGNVHYKNHEGLPTGWHRILKIATISLIVVGLSLSLILAVTRALLITTYSGATAYQPDLWLVGLMVVILVLISVFMEGCTAVAGEGTLLGLKAIWLFVVSVTRLSCALITLLPTAIESVLRAVYRLLLHTVAFFGYVGYRLGITSPQHLSDVLGILRDIQDITGEKLLPDRWFSVPSQSAASHGGAQGRNGRRGQNEAEVFPGTEEHQEEFGWLQDSGTPSSAEWEGIVEEVPRPRLTPISRQNFDPLGLGGEGEDELHG